MAKLTTTPNGKYGPFKSNREKLCDCHVGFDYVNHVITCCKNKATWVWYRRMWIQEIMRETSPLYDTLGACMCNECFEKTREMAGPPSDLEELRAKWEANKTKGGVA